MKAGAVLALGALNVYQSMGQPEKARDVWRKGVEVFPENTGLHEKFGEVSE